MTTGTHPPERRFDRGPIAIFLLLCVCIVTLEAVFYAFRSASIKKQIYSELSAIADLKRDQIVEWRKDRLSFARFVMSNPFARQAVANWLGHKSDTSLRDSIVHWMNDVRDHHDYANVTLVDRNGLMLLTVDTGTFGYDSATGACIAAALKSGEPFLCDLHINVNSTAHLELIVPINGNNDNSLSAALVFGIDPNQFLYPLIETWPLPSKSGETVLFRKSGNKIEFLNELRHKRNTALQFTLPADKPRFLAAEALRRDSGGIADALDYRDKPVLGAFRSIPGSPWYMVAKMDKSEVLSPVRRLFAIMVGFAVALIACAGLLVVAFERRQRAAYYRALFGTEQRLRQSEERFRLTVEDSKAGYFFMDKDGIFRSVNKAWLALYGFSDPVEIIGRHFDTVQVPQDVGRARETVNGIMRGEKPYLSGEFSRKCRDGSIGYHTFSARPVAQEGTVIGIEGFIIDSTERRKAREALAALSARNEAILNTVPDIVAEVDKNKVYTWLNKAGLTFFGADAVGREAAYYFEGDQNTYAKVQPLFNGNTDVFYVESWQRRYDGQKRLLAWWCQALNDEKGNVTGALSTARDITELRAAEVELAESEKRYRMVSELATDYVYKLNVNPDGKVSLAFVTDNFFDITGRKREEALTVESWSGIFHPHDLPAAMGHLRDLCRNPGTSEFECRTIVHGDRQRWVHIIARSNRDEREGRVTEIVGAVKDITDRKQYESAIIAEKERFLVTLRSIGDGVITTDTRGIITFMNRVAEGLTGWGLEESVGKLLTEVFHIINEQTRTRCENPVDKVLATGGIIGLANHTILISRTGRQIVIADSGAPIRDRASVVIGVVLVFRDITDKQKTEDALSNAERLESIGALAGGIAHDFNNLLGGVFGFMDLALGESKQKKVTDYLSKAMGAMERARSLTRQLLTFSKGGAPVRRPGPLFPFVEETARFALSGSNVTLVCESPGDLWMCNFDINQIGQVIDNIVLNGQQAMPQGGAIQISAANVTIDGHSAGTLKPGQYVKISIKDGGIGIPAEILSRIFDPFFTTKQKGSGLGLATSYSIMTKHDGWIDVESGSGRGSTFYLYLPALAASVRTVSPAAALKTAHQGRGTVLVLDDEEVMRDSITGMLASLGYSAECFADGAGLVEYFTGQAQKGKSFTALILDLTVPGGMGGEAAAAAIRKIDRAVPLFVASGYAEDPILAAPRQYGFTDSICKPFIKAELAAMLAKHIKSI
jgi:two-component system cell cycle sensor histidine kinase/response regulator CckA